MLSSKISDMTLLLIFLALILGMFFIWFGMGQVQYQNTTLQNIVKACAYKDADNSARSQYGTYYLTASDFKDDVASMISDKYGSSASTPTFTFYGYETTNGTKTATTVTNSETVPDDFAIVIVRVDTTINHSSYTTRYALNRATNQSSTDLTYIQQGE